MTRICEQINKLRMSPHVHKRALKWSFQLSMLQYNVQVVVFFFFFPGYKQIIFIRSDVRQSGKKDQETTTIADNIDLLTSNLTKAKEGSCLSYGKPHQHHQNSTSRFSPESKNQQIKNPENVTWNNIIL